MFEVREVVIAPRAPWQNAYAERVIGSIRRECLDHVVVIGARHLREILSKYVDQLDSDTFIPTKDVPEPDCAAAEPEQGVEVSRVGGLHHEYLRRGMMSCVDGFLEG